VDSEGAAWTLSPQLETLRNGVQAGGGLGFEYRICAGKVYVLGLNYVWHRYGGGANGNWIPYENPTCSSGPSLPPPATDSDGDGLPDAADQCPTQPGSPPKGCPLPPSQPAGPVDGEGAVWTLGPQLETLRNGIQAGGGLGFELRICNGQAYVLGLNYIWHRYSGGAGGNWIPYEVPPCSSGPSPPSPPADSDGDGVPDTVDQCPTQPASTSNGCPLQPGTPGQLVDGEDAVWTLGPLGETLRNGVQVGGGAGLELRICGGVTTVFAWRWYMYTGGPNGGWIGLEAPACGAP
jgi:hypothetical protein